MSDKSIITTKNLIIGGGISGLTAAHFLKDNYLIVEKESEPGGYCKTIKNPNYVWDYAGHFYHFKTKEMENLFKSLVEEKEVVLKEKNTKIFIKDSLIDYPFQTNIHQLSKQDLINSIYDLFFKDEKENYDNFLDMLYGKFGKTIVELFLKPYNEKLYATDLSTLDTNAMGRFFPYANLEEIIKNFKDQKKTSYNDTFLYLKKGTQYFTDKLFSTLDSDKVLLNTSITSIDEDKKIALTTDGKEIHYENVISTIPLNHLLKITKESRQALLDEMSYNKVLVLNLGFDKKSPNYTDEHWIYFPDKALNFYRVGFYDNILDGDKLSIYVEIGYSKNAPIDVDYELKETLKNLKAVGIIDDTMNLMDKSVIIMDPAYVHISESTNEKIDKLKNSLEEKQIYTTGRYGKWTYSSMEDCMIWAKELVDKVK